MVRGEHLGELLEWLDRHVNMETGVGFSPTARSFDPPTLERMRSLLRYLGDPQLDLDAIHITGTNGKGSTARMAAALVSANGASVAAYTSPHLERINERITIEQAPIDDDALAEVLAAARRAEDAASVSCSWFELVTAAAFRAASDHAAAATVVEVGAGGRWDATNTLDARVAVVTNVELDHMEWLGSTRELIASEKIGIVKPDAVAVIGETDPALADQLCGDAHTQGAASVLRAGTDFACVHNRFALGGRVVTIRTPRATYEDLLVPLHGAHQGANAAAALCAVEAFFDAPLPERTVRAGFAHVTHPGRLEVIARSPVVLLDGAHNPAGARAVALALAESFPVAPRRVVIGLLRGRDPAAMLDAFAFAPGTELIAVAPPSQRALDPQEIRTAAEARGLRCTVADGVVDAVERGRAGLQEGDLLFVTGSLYLVGAIRALIGGPH